MRTQIGYTNYKMGSKCFVRVVSEEYFLYLFPKCLINILDCVDWYKQAHNTKDN